MNWSIWSLSLILLVTFPQELHVERPTEEETRQAQEVADKFERVMRETRDAVALQDLFLSDFMRRQIEQEKMPGGPLVSIPSLPLTISSDLIAHVSQNEWERLYVAQLNFRYYFVLLIASRLKPGEIENSKEDFRQKLFPADVLTLLQADPFLRQQYGSDNDQMKSNIETIQELRSLISTLERATLILRGRFLKNPPERTDIYQENLRHASVNATRSIQPDVSSAPESMLGFPKGTRFFHRLTADSLFELWLVKTDRGMKIAWARVYPFN